MTEFFGRHYEFKSDDLSFWELRIRFQITKSLVGYPNTAKFEIYNLSEDSRNKLIAGENGIGRSVYADGKGSEIQFSAGYAEPKLLFIGKVVNVIHKYIAPDWITEVYAGDAVDVLNTATINKTLQAGATTEQIFNTLVSEMQGITKGVTQGLSNCLEGNRSALRALQLSGNVKDWMEWLAERCGFEWSINEQRIETMSKGTPLTDEEPMIINQDSGMLGSPMRTDTGVDVTNLLLPELKLARRFRVQAVNDYINVGNMFFRKIPPVRNQGVYRVDKLVHSGDSRGDKWETKISGRVYG